MESKTGTTNGGGGAVSGNGIGASAGLGGSGMSAVRYIALMNQKGGVGKTTTAVNLSAGIARLGRRVLLVDLDPQAHTTLHVGIDPASICLVDGGTGSVYDVLTCEDSLRRELMLGAIREVEPNLLVLPAETDLAGAETELASADPAERTTRLKTALEGVIGEMGSKGPEFVIFDCPPSLGLLTLNALAAAREVFIPMQAQFLALQGVGKLLETVSLISRGQGGVNPRLRVTGIVLCMHETTTTHSKEVVADLVQFFDNARQGAEDSPWKTARVLTPAIRRNIKLAECPSFGKTIFDYAPTSAGAADYAGLAQRVVNEWDAMLARRSGANGAAIGGAERSGECVEAEVEAKPTSRVQGARA